MADHKKLLKEVLLLTNDLMSIMEGYDPKPGQVRISPRFRDRALLVTQKYILRSASVIDLLKEIDVKSATKESTAKRRIAEAILVQVSKQPGWFKDHSDAVKFIVMFGPIAHVVAERDIHVGKSFKEDPTAQVIVFKKARRLAKKFAKEHPEHFNEMRETFAATLREYVNSIEDSQDTGEPLDDESKAEAFESMIYDVYDEYLRSIREKNWLRMLKYAEDAEDEEQIEI